MKRSAASYRMLSLSKFTPVLAFAFWPLCLSSCMTSARVEANVRSLVAQNRFADARKEISESSVNDRQKRRLAAIVDVGQGESSMTAGQYMDAMNHFADALHNDSENKVAAREDCLAAYRYFVNQSFHPGDSSNSESPELKSAADACKRTAYGSQLMPFISSNLKSHPTAP